MEIPDEAYQRTEIAASEIRVPAEMAGGESICGSRYPDNPPLSISSTGVACASIVFPAWWVICISE